MKKFVLILLTLCLVLGLAGCNRTVTEEEVNAIMPCTYEDGVYKNELFSIGFEAPEDWTCSDWEDILERNGWSDEEDMVPQLVKTMGKLCHYYELLAERQDAKAGANVCIENAAVLGNPDDTEESYLTRSMEVIRDHFERLEADRLSIQTVREEFAGQMHHGYYAKCETGGTPYYYKAMFIKEGIYVAVVTATSAEEDLTDEVLSMFYEV